MNGGRTLRPAVVGILREVGRLVTNHPDLAPQASDAYLHAQEQGTDGMEHAQALIRKQAQDDLAALQGTLGDETMGPASPSAPVDPNTTRSRRFDEITWGSSDTQTFVNDPAVVVPFIVESQQLVALGVHPPRAVAVAMVWTPVNKAFWDTDAGTYIVTFDVTIGLGRSRETLHVASAALTTPFPAQLVVGLPIALLPIRDLQITAKVTGTGTVAAGSYVSRFFACAAPVTIDKETRG